MTGLLRPALYAALLLQIAAWTQAATYFDDFSTTSAARITQPGWSRITTPAEGSALRGESRDSSLAWRRDAPLQAHWAVDVDVRIDETFGELAKNGAGIVLAGNEASTPSPLVHVSIEHQLSKITMVRVSDAKYGRILESDWIPGTDTRFHLQLKRPAGKNQLEIMVLGDAGLRYRFTTPEIAKDVLDRATLAALQVRAVRAEFRNLTIQTETQPPDVYRDMAVKAVDDLTYHFWRGDYASGQVVNTWGLPAEELPVPQGALWDRGQFTVVLENLYRITGDPTLKQRIRSEWRRDMRTYREGEIEEVGKMPNPACDDAGWNAWFMLRVYQTTGDPTALDHAKKVVVNAWNHWSDKSQEGSLWYDNSRTGKSSYQGAITLDALTIYELTHDKDFLKRARTSYDWMEAHLSRPDGLYWQGLTPDGPLGKERPDDIHEGGSVSLLCGNFLMGILHARFYRLTGEKKYLERAQRTADAIAKRMTNGKGVLLDAGAAKINGTFVGEWAREVLTLPGIDPKNIELIRTTARSIYENDRTPDGYYGGCWAGPADGPGSIWSVIDSRPQNITVSTSSANVIVGAAALPPAP